MIADKLEAALAAAPSTSPAAAEVAGEPVASVYYRISDGGVKTLCATIFAGSDLKPGDKLYASPSAAEQAGRWVPGEPLYLVHAGGDGYQAEIVPESKLDDAYLLTQFGSLDDIDPEQRAAALAHFHDDDEWTHEEVTGNGPRLKFGLSLEDGWIEVIRLPLAAPSASPAEAPADQSPDDLRERFDAWLKTTPNWAPEYEQHRAWVELFAWWAVHALAAHPQPVAPAGAWHCDGKSGPIAGQAAAGVQGAVVAWWQQGDPRFPQPRLFLASEFDPRGGAWVKGVVHRPLVFGDAPAPAVERGVAEELPPAFDYAASKAMAVTKEWCRGWDDARAALSTAGKEQA